MSSKPNSHIPPAIPVVSVSKFTEIIKRTIEYDIKRPIFGLGKGGIGKSESIASLAKELNIGYIDIRLLLYTESDLKGIPFINKEASTTVWLQNDILPRVDRDGETGILVLDEVTSCNKSLRTAAYQLLNERTLGEYELPENWFIVCLGNGEEDGGQFNGMEGNFANRCSVYTVTTEIQSWAEWAIQANIYPAIIHFLEFNHQYLHTYNDEEDDVFLFASPRSWKAVSDVMIKAEKFGHRDDPITYDQIRANIGSAIANEFIQFLLISDYAMNLYGILEGEVTEIPPTQELIIDIINRLNGLLHDIISEESPDISDDTIVKVANFMNFLFKLPRLEDRTIGIQNFVKLNKKDTKTIFSSNLFKDSCPDFLEFVKANTYIFED